jgi:hypothetical protein
MAEKKAVLVEVPEDLAEAVKRFVSGVEASTPETRGGRAVDFGAFEDAVEKRAAELEQAVHRRLLHQLDIDAPRVVIRGKPHTRVGRYEATYKTKAGPIEVTRSIYREDGQRNAKVVDPVSMRAGAVEDGGGAGHGVSVAAGDVAGGGEDCPGAGTSPLLSFQL